MEEKEICHVCKKEKKPYTIFMNNSIMSFIENQQAREDGYICKRCNQYYAMTGEFKEPTEEEFEVAKKSSWFARTMLKWWTRDKDLDDDLESDSKRDWEGTYNIAKWCRTELTRKTEGKKCKKKQNGG